jgi:hypothetical protein
MGNGGSEGDTRQRRAVGLERRSRRLKTKKEMRDTVLNNNNIEQ